MSDLFFRKFGVTPEEYRAGKRSAGGAVRVENEQAAKRQSIGNKNWDAFLTSIGITEEMRTAFDRKQIAELKQRMRETESAKPHGVGWHMKQLLEGITVEGCSCKSVANLADKIGPSGCRERKAELVAKLGEALAKLTGERLAKVTEKLQALGGIEGLIEESIRRAEHSDQEECQRDGQEKEQATAAHQS